MYCACIEAFFFNFCIDDMNIHMELENWKWILLYYILIFRQWNDMYCMCMMETAWSLIVLQRFILFDLYWYCNDIIYHHYQFIVFTYSDFFGIICEMLMCLFVLFDIIYILWSYDWLFYFEISYMCFVCVWFCGYSLWLCNSSFWYNIGIEMQVGYCSVIVFYSRRCHYWN